MKLNITSVLPTKSAHSASVIFFHGSGDTGPNIRAWVRQLLGRDMAFSHIKVLYPTAPLQKYTPNGGELSNVWFDRYSISVEAKEHKESLSSIYEIVNDLIQQEASLGIPANRIIVGGFSMGGALAIHTAYHLNNNLAGAFACSSFLNRGSAVYDTIKAATKNGTTLPELKMFHGQEDSLVPIQWAQETLSNLSGLGVKGQFVELDNCAHELKKNALLDIEDWINKKLPNVTETGPIDLNV